MFKERLGGLRHARTCAAVMMAVWAVSGMADEKSLLAAIESQSGAIKAVSQQIFDFKELGQQEFKSSQLVMEELRKLGFKVEGDLKVPDDLVKGGVAKTAFRAAGIRRAAEWTFLRSQPDFRFWPARSGRFVESDEGFAGSPGGDRHAR